MAMAMDHSLLTPIPDLLENPPQSPQSEAEVDTPTDHTTPAPSVFDQTTDNLLRLGSLTLDKFAHDPSEELDGFDIPLVDAAGPNATGYYLGDTTATHANKDEENFDEIPIVAPADAVRFLRDAAQRDLGQTSFDPFKFEYIEEPGQAAKSCILTISRPNGLSRSYRTKAEFARKPEAKMAAASSAIKLGALSFIKFGDTTKRGLVLAKLDAGVKKDEGDTEVGLKSGNEGQGGEDIEGAKAIAEIDRCCFEWRAGSVIPKWVYLVEKKLPEAFGCALKLSLSSHIQRTYSVLVSSDYTKKSHAKAACAKLALEQGVIEFIRHGDGLKEPMAAPFFGAEAMAPTAASATSLQAFHDSLPKPMPDHMGVKGNGEINAVSWLNTVVQSAKGSRMIAAFHWYTDTKAGLHGCLLRLSRPDGPSQSYLVDAFFSKRADAKVAVCILACSQGVGDYIRAVAAEIEARVTMDMRRRCNEQLFHSLGQALNKIRHGLRPDFAYECELSTFGCTLTVNLTSDTDTEQDSPIKKQWSVPLAYKSKMDARIAVTCVAADDGLLTFIKYRGQPPPTSDDQASEGEVANELVDVEMEDGEAAPEGGKKKKQKKAKRGNDDATGEVVESEGRNTANELLVETKEAARARGKSVGWMGKKLQPRQFNGRGRGAGFGRHSGFVPNGPRAGVSSHAPVRRRPFGDHAGFPAPHPSFHHFQPPPHHHYRSYGPSAPARFHPYAVIPGGLGFPGGAYPLEYEQHGYFLADPGPAHEGYAHGLGRSGVNMGTSFTRVPLPMPPPVMPAYRRYRDRDRSHDYDHEHELDQGLNAQPSSSSAPASVSSLPYDTESAAAAGDPHSRASEQGRYAPDYDRIPDRNAVTRESGAGDASSNQGSMTSRLASHSQASSQPVQQNGDGMHSTGGAPPGKHNSNLTDDPPPSQNASGDPSVSRKGDTRRYGLQDHVLQVEQLRPRKLSSRPRLVKHQPDTRAHSPAEMETDNVTAETGKATIETGSEHTIPTPLSKLSQPPSPAAGYTPSVTTLPAHNGSDRSTPDETVTVPSKRRRSPIGEDTEPTLNERARRRSQSLSQGSEQGRTESERVGSNPLPAERVKSVPTEDLEQGPEKTACSSQALDATEHDGKTEKRVRDKTRSPQKQTGSQQKEKSYVTALLGHCTKKGLPSPEICHEKMSDEESDKPYKVWVIMGKERLELPTTFPTLVAGKERVAKSVLGRLKVQGKKLEEI